MNNDHEALHEVLVRFVNVGLEEGATQQCVEEDIILTSSARNPSLDH